MNRINGIASYILLVLLTIVVSSCGIDPLTGVDSPSGNKIAFVYKKRFSSSETHVSIINKNDDLPRKGNVAVFKGVVSLTVEWQNENELTLHAPDTATVISIKKRVGDVIVNLTQ